jgi:hypothetical protein
MLISHRSSWLRGLGLVCLSAALGGGTSQAEEAVVEAPKEYQVKAIFLYNFANYVFWPVEALGDPRQPFTICVMGEDPFRKELDRVVAGENINGHAVALLRIEEPEQAKPCHIVFVSTSKKRHQALILQALIKQPTLTVGESEDFVHQGGMIQFFSLGNKIRFSISPQIAKEAGLKISAHLLRVAEVK